MPIFRTLIVIAGVAAIAACDPRPAPGKPAAPAAATTDPNSETLGRRYIDLLPQWVPIANTPDGGKIAYDLKGLKTPVNGIVEIDLQVTHGAAQQTTIEEATVVRKVSYRQELVRLRYRCPDSQFAIVGREIRDDADKPVLKEDTPAAAFAPVSGNGLAKVAYNPACAKR